MKKKTKQNKTKKHNYNIHFGVFDRTTGEYVRYVFSVGPGAVSLLGFLAVIAFLPATVKCKKVGKSKQGHVMYHVRFNLGEP